jgi:hypothetical protein
MMLRAAAAAARLGNDNNGLEMLPLAGKAMIVRHGFMPTKATKTRIETDWAGTRYNYGALSGTTRRRDTSTGQSAVHPHKVLFWASQIDSRVETRDIP